MLPINQACRAEKYKSKPKKKNRGAHTAPRFEIQKNQAGMLSVSGEITARIIMHMLHMRIIPIMLLPDVRAMGAVSFHLDCFKL